VLELGLAGKRVTARLGHALCILLVVGVIGCAQAGNQENAKVSPAELKEESKQEAEELLKVASLYYDKPQAVIFDSIARVNSFFELRGKIIAFVAPGQRTSLPFQFVTRIDDDGVRTVSFVIDGKETILNDDEHALFLAAKATP